MALAQRRPKGVVHHSDKGSQYTSLAFGKRCREMEVVTSTGSAGDCFHNAMAEIFLPPRVRADRAADISRPGRSAHGHLRIRGRLVQFQTPPFRSGLPQPQRGRTRRSEGRYTPCGDHRPSQPNHGTRCALHFRDGVPVIDAATGEGLDETDPHRPRINRLEALFGETPDLFVRVGNDTMTGAGVGRGDLAAIAQNREPEPGDLEAAQINDAVEVRRFVRTHEGDMLKPEPEKWVGRRGKDGDPNKVYN